MKKVLIKALCCLMVLLCVATPLAACGGAPLTVAKNGESKYQIVYANGDKEAADAANRLSAELEDLTGAVLTVTDDRTEVDKKIPEILVGRTNRGTAYPLQRTLLKGEYVIAREGKTVYILGAGEGILSLACDEFLENVLTDKFKVSGKGELARSSKPQYRVSEVTLNGKVITDYTVLVPAGSSSLNWKNYFAYVEETLAALSGNLLTISTYDDISAPPVSPAILLNGSTEGLGKTEYKIEQSGENIVFSAGSEEVAMAMAIGLMDQLSYHGKESVAAELKAGGGKVGENPLVPMTDAGELRAMCYNVYATTKEHKSNMPYVAASIYAYAPDFLCLQECPPKGDIAQVALKNMESAGYGLVGDVFTEVSPTALDHAATDEHYQRFAYVGKTSYTPIYYRTDRWETVESGSYLFYWKHRYHMTNTKSLSYGVFKNKADGSLVLVISTHFPLMSSNYAGNGDNYKTYSGTDAQEGAAWRDGATAEVLREVNEMRAKYPGILVVVGGDMNAHSTEKSMKTFEAHEALADAIVMAPADYRSSGTSFHAYGKEPPANGTPIDHWFVSEDVASVGRHVIVADPLTLQGSDHCPVVIDFSKK